MGNSSGEFRRIWNDEYFDMGDIVRAITLEEGGYHGETAYSHLRCSGGID